MFQKSEILLQNGEDFRGKPDGGVHQRGPAGSLRTGARTAASKSLANTKSPTFITVLRPYDSSPQYGKISDCEKLTDKPFGFVHMEEYNVSFLLLLLLLLLPAQDAQQASRKLHGLAYKGKRLRVELSNRSANILSFHVILSSCLLTCPTPTTGHKPVILFLFPRPCPTSLVTNPYGIQVT